MGTNKARVLALLFLLGFVHPANCIDEVSCLKQTAIHEIGVKESGCDNCGERVEQYLRSVKLGKGNPWCAAFVSWCFQQHCISNPKSGYVPNWFQKNIVYDRRKITGKEVIRSMDTFCIYFKELGRPAHIGFVLEYEEGENLFTTIEGNSTDVNSGPKSREGVAVIKKYRLKSQIYQVSRWL